MSDSDDDIQIIESSDQPAKSTWPTETEIDEITERMVVNWVEQGNDPNDLKLKKVLKRFNDCGFTGNFIGNPEYIRSICKRLRFHQKRAPKVEISYYRGNISSIDVATLNNGEWLNDAVVNRYMDLIASTHNQCLSVSSFFMESMESKKGAEKLPESLTEKMGLMPVNVHAHWVLAVISLVTKSIYLFDSMGSTTTTDLTLLLDKLRKHINDKFNIACKVKVYKQVKSQTNCDDCGAFVLLYARDLAEGGFYLNQLGARHMKGLRAWFKEEIMDGKLRPWDDFIQSRRDVKRVARS